MIWHHFTDSLNPDHRPCLLWVPVLPFLKNKINTSTFVEDLLSSSQMSLRIISTTMMEEPGGACLCVCVCVQVCVCAGQHMHTHGVTCTSILHLNNECSNLSWSEWYESSPFAHLANPSTLILRPQRNALNPAKIQMLLWNTELYEIYFNTEGTLYMLLGYQALFMLQGVICIWTPSPWLLLFFTAPANLLDFNVGANFWLLCGWNFLLCWL